MRAFLRRLWHRITATQYQEGGAHSVNIQIGHIDGKRADSDARAANDSAWFSVWLHGKWSWLTKHMTTEEREAAADAVERARVREGLPPFCDDSRLMLRWWRYADNPPGPEERAR